MSSLTQGDIQVESVVPIAAIQDFYMEVQRNAHIYVRIEGNVSDEAGEECLLQPLAGTKLTIRVDDRILFEGMLKEAQLKQEGMGYYVSLLGVSFTELLDYQRKRRTFQNISMTYREVMKQVLSDIEEVRLQFHVEDQEIGMPVYQIEETDWAFLMRMAGRFNTGIITSAYSIRSDVHIGMPKGQKHRADDKAVRERIWYDRESRSICMYVKTSDSWEIGDRIEWENRELTVTGKKCRLEYGLLQFYYTLTEKAVIRADTSENPYAAGLLLSAEVLDIKEEQIRVKFDIDREQNRESAYWYPWEPDMGNLVYCMPEKGERVYVRIGDVDENKGRVVCGVRRNGTNNPEMNSSHRYFTTKGGKRMYLTPDAIGFRDMKTEKTLQAELKDEMGAGLISHCNLTIIAEDTVRLKGNNVLFQAPEEISLVKKALAPTVLNMCNGFDLIGAADRVVMEGSKEEEFPVFYREDQGKANYVFKEPEKMAACMIGSTPSVELNDSLEYKLEGCQVKQLGRSRLL